MLWLFLDVCHNKDIRVFPKYFSLNSMCAATKIFIIKRIITVRKRSWGKVMFSQACVKNSVHGGEVYTSPPRADTLPGRHPMGIHPPPQADTSQSRHLPRQTPPWPSTSLGRHLLPGQTLPLADGYCCGRYASYWNAFLFEFATSCVRDQSVITYSAWHRQNGGSLYWPNSCFNYLSEFTECSFHLVKTPWCRLKASQIRLNHISDLRCLLIEDDKTTQHNKNCDIIWVFPKLKRTQF